MSPLEFVLWANGATEVLGGKPPTEEQWQVIRAKLDEVTAKLVASKLLEQVDRQQNRRAQQVDDEVLKQKMAELQKLAALPQDIQPYGVYPTTGVSSRGR